MDHNFDNHPYVGFLILAYNMARNRILIVKALIPQLKD